MRLKKLFFIIFIILIIYLFCIKIINKKNIEKFNNQFKDDPAPYSDKCRQKFNTEPNYFKYSTNDLSNVYSLINYNKCIDLYYKDLANNLGNLNNNNNNLSNNICKLKSVKNLNYTKSNSNKNLFNIFNTKNNNNTKVPSCDTCKIPDIITYISKDNNIILKFQKISSINSEFETSKDDNINNLTNDDIEYSNEIFTEKLIQITSNNNNIIKDFIDKTKNLNDNLYSIYYKIEEFLLNKINSLNSLKDTNTENFRIIRRFINYFLVDKNNQNNCDIDIDLLIYRKYKNNGKHINFMIQYYNNVINISCIRILGIVNSSDIMLYNGDMGYIEKKYNKDFFLSLGNINDLNIYSLTDMNNQEVKTYIEDHNKELSMRL